MRRYEAGGSASESQHMPLFYARLAVISQDIKIGSAVSDAAACFGIFRDARRARLYIVMDAHPRRWLHISHARMPASQQFRFEDEIVGEHSGFMQQRRSY